MILSVRCGRRRELPMYRDVASGVRFFCEREKAAGHFPLTKNRVRDQMFCETDRKSAFPVKNNLAWRQD